jgi:hypothetical protein
MNPDYLLLQGEQARHFAACLRIVADQIEAGEHAGTAFHHIGPWRPPSQACARPASSEAQNAGCGAP